MKAKFKKFLTDNRAYRKFENNIKIDNNRSFDEYCDRDENWGQVITNAFYWYCTTEGEKYWNALNNKWNDQTS